MITAIIIAMVGLILFITATLTETALTSCNRLRIELDIKQEKPYAIHAERLLGNKVLLLWSFKFFRSVMTALATISFTVLAFKGLLPGDMPFYAKVSVIILISALIIIFIGTVLPKWIASRYPDVILMNMYWFALFVSRVTSPLSLRRADNPSMIIEEEEEESAEAEIIHNAINFPDVLLRECMIPRTEVVAISSGATPEEILTLFRDSNYSRIPVYDGNIDRITGYIHSKDLLSGKKSAGELLRKIEYYPEEMGAKDLLATMTKNRGSIAVVLDKWGGTAGIVTLEDLIEEIFGEISDELDNDEFREKQTGEGEFIFSARLEIKYLNREYELEIPESEEYETLGGFITWFNENIPRQGDVLTYENIQITILRTTRSRLELVRLKLLGL
ncbi:MAG: HlyC/CorC family transporter [Bacteroidales bacterium]|nr:HlyC/CorC family transporter [Bacteroidales bacterium]